MGLWPFSCWDRGLESRPNAWMSVSSVVLSVVQVEFSATGRSLVLMCPSECGLLNGEPCIEGSGQIGESYDVLL